MMKLYRLLAELLVGLFRRATEQETRDALERARNVYGGWV